MNLTSMEQRKKRKERKKERKTERKKERQRERDIERERGESELGGKGNVFRLSPLAMQLTSQMCA